MKITLKSLYSPIKVFKIAIRNFMQTFEFLYLRSKYPSTTFKQIFNHIYFKHNDKIQPFCERYAAKFMNAKTCINISELDNEKIIALKIIKVLWSELKTQQLLMQGKTIALNLTGMEQLNINFDILFYEIEKRGFIVKVLFNNNIGIKRKSKSERRI